MIPITLGGELHRLELYYEILKNYFANIVYLDIVRLWNIS